MKIPVLNCPYKFNSYFDQVSIMDTELMRKIGEIPIGSFSKDDYTFYAEFRFDVYRGHFVSVYTSKGSLVGIAPVDGVHGRIDENITTSIMEVIK